MAWTIAPNSGYTTDGATFSPAGCGTISGSTVTINNVTGPHTCTVTLQSSDPLKSFTYTGDYAIKKASDYNLDTSNGDYTVLALLSDGELTFSTSFNADIFMVGGGGGGSRGDSRYRTSSGGGGGGYTKTYTNQTIGVSSIDVIIGAGGAGSTFNSVGGAGGTTFFGSLSVSGATQASSIKIGGNGGSGGGSGTPSETSSNKNTGGFDGKDGGGYNTSIYAGGKGQGTTTSAFGETGATLFAGGGGGGNYSSTAVPGGDGGGGNGGGWADTPPHAGEPNTGGGGGGASDFYAWGGDGGSGIILIRVHK